MEKIFSYYYEWWKNIDKFIFFTIFLLFLLGLFFSLVSTSIIASDKLNTNTYYFFIKHLFFIFLGMFLLISFSFLNMSKILFLVSLVTLALIPFIGIEVKGSARWLDLPFFPRFQPIELVKPFFIIMVSLILSLKDRNNLYIKYLFSLGIVIPIILFLISQPDIGQTLLIILTWLSLVFVSGINLIFFFSFFIIIISFLSYLIVFLPKFEYIRIRLSSFLDPNSGNNYQSEKASEAISNGGFFGMGIG